MYTFILFRREIKKNVVINNFIYLYISHIILCNTYKSSLINEATFQLDEVHVG